MERMSLRNLLFLGGKGGGGSSNFVTGTFTGETAGTTMDVTIPYTGNGYPVAILVYPTTGTYAENSDIYDLAQKSAVMACACIKVAAEQEPSYLSADSSLEKNKCTYLVRYKNSDEDPTAMSTSAGEGATFTSYVASTSPGAVVRMSSATAMSVYIAGTSYGFPKDIEFTYQIIYSE